MKTTHIQPRPNVTALPPAVSHSSPAGQTPGYPRLVADIGGTNARFALIDAPDGSLHHVRSMKAADYDGPAAAVEAYLGALAGGGMPARRPVAAAIALATPIVSDRIEMTNMNWSFSRSALQADLGLDVLVMLNDFEALALSLPRLGAGQLRTDGNRIGAGGVMAAIGPGTGLGVGGVMHTAAGWVALAGEGGHMTLAPTDDYESELLACMRKELPHVSAERVLAGVGLPLLHRAVAKVGGKPVRSLTAEQIVNGGVEGTDELCGVTLDVFCALLGNFAGNVALTLGARAGVYIGGGIVPRLGDRFFASRFREQFEAKGRFRDYLSEIPTYLITDTLAALTGAASALDQPQRARYPAR